MKISKKDKIYRDVFLDLVKFAPKGSIIIYDEKKHKIILYPSHFEYVKIVNNEKIT